MSRTTISCALAFLLSPSVALAQGYAPVDPDTECKPDETMEECRERLCEDDESQEECQRRLEKEREEKREEREEAAREQREEAEERARERQEEAEEEREDQRERRRRRRGDDDDDDDDYDSGSSGGDSSAEEVLRPSTRPMFFVGGIGPTFFGLNRDFRGRGGFGRGRGAGSARGKLGLDFGYHFSGDGEGPAIGASIEQTFDDTFYVFNPAFKFWWDIMPVDEYGIYIAPFAKAGYALVEACSRFLNCPGHAFNIGMGVEGRLVIEDRGMVFLRPVQLDTYLGDVFGDTFWLNYSILVGGGVTF